MGSCDRLVGLFEEILMKRIFYRIEDKTYFDIDAFNDLVAEKFPGVEITADLFKSAAPMPGTHWIEV